MNDDKLMRTGTKPNKAKQELNRNRHVTVHPPPGRRVPRRKSTIGEGGRAPWRLVQDRDTEEASRVDQADPGAMADQAPWPWPSAQPLLP